MSVLKIGGRNRILWNFYHFGAFAQFPVSIYSYSSIFTRRFGINVKLYSYVAVANILYTYGMETAFFRFAAEDKTRYYNLIQTALLVTSTIFSGVLILFSSSIITI
jgi:hypothetical protein